MQLKAGVAALVAFAAVVALTAVLAWLTRSPSQHDPCADPQQDISGAVLADDPGAQDALVNRAIMMRRLCVKQRAEQQRGESTADSNAEDGREGPRGTDAPREQVPD